MNFVELEHFKEWKRKIEGEDGAFFIITSSKKTQNGKRCYYACNRSGSFRLRVPEDKRKRRLKKQGSRKINSACTARFTACFSQRGVFVKNFHRVHSGHESEPIHLPIPSPEKNRSATEIAAKVPFEYILGNTQSELSTSEVTRTHLINKQDLHNIAVQFGLKKDNGKIDPDDATSVGTWVLEEQGKNNESSILLYKPWGEVSNGLGVDDFLLGVMTNEQKEILQKFGMDVITIDSTHRTNAHKFEITTVLVLDEFGQGFPCAFLFSNMINQKFIEIFLTAIREKVGVVSPKVFMSDIAESFYNAWTSVMGQCEKRLYCTWHVLRAWQKNLNSIRNLKLKSEAWKRVRALLTEPDKAAFVKDLPVMIDWLCSDKDSADFGNYFKEFYSGNYAKWAYCFWKNAGINTNMHLDLFHRELKYNSLNVKMAKRLDLTIHSLMRLVKKRFYDRLRCLAGGKLVPKVRTLRLRHNSSASLSTDNVFVSSENAWVVFSSDFVNIYDVKLTDPTCSCSLVCDICQACCHKFSCSCPDHAISSNMCKHIHLVCRFLSLEENIKSNLGPTVGTGEEPTKTFQLEKTRSDEVEDFCSQNRVQEPEECQEASSYHSLKNERKELCEIAQSVIQRCTTRRQLRWAKRCLDLMDFVLEATRTKRQRPCDGF